MILDQLVEQFKEAEPMPVDAQIIHLRKENKAQCVALNILLRQFKFTCQNSRSSEEYLILRSAIQKMYGTSLITRLEVSQ